MFYYNFEYDNLKIFFNHEKVWFLTLTYGSIICNIMFQSPFSAFALDPKHSFPLRSNLCFFLIHSNTYELLSKDRINQWPPSRPQFTLSALTSANTNGPSYNNSHFPALIAATDMGPHWYIPKKSLAQLSTFPSAEPFWIW